VQDRLVAQEFRRLIVDEQNIQFFLREIGLRCTKERFLSRLHVED
jgi:hypothetical protein